MSNVARERRAAREALHNELARPFRAYADGPTGDTDDVSARLHTTPVMVGEVVGGGPGLAEFHELRPRLVFLKSEHTPRRGSVYILNEDGLDRDNVFVVEVVEPPDGVTVTALCAFANAARVNEYLPAGP